MDAQPELPSLHDELPSISAKGLKTSLEELTASLDTVRGGPPFA